MTARRGGALLALLWSAPCAAELPLCMDRESFWDGPCEDYAEDGPLDYYRSCDEWSAVQRCHECNRCRDPSPDEVAAVQTLLVCENTCIHYARGYAYGSGNFMCEDGGLGSSTSYCALRRSQNSKLCIFEKLADRAKSTPHKISHIYISFIYTYA